MEKDKLQQPQQSNEVAGENDIWQSAFDSNRTPSAPPPELHLTANHAQGAVEWEGGDGEYAPETVVFDIGGYADPQNPGQGNGKGIRVVIPPDLDGPTALVQVMMRMMRLSEAEAVTMIVRENLQWVNYQFNGQGLDRAGNAVHLLRFKPIYSERTAHEPATLRPLESEALGRYKDFKEYLGSLCGDESDPYGQFDQYAQAAGIFIPHITDPGLDMFGLNMEGARADYEDLREKVVEYVVWERLRAKREGLAAGIDKEKGGMQSTVQALADSFPAMLDLETLRQYLPGSYYTAWVSLHARMIAAQGALEQGDASMMQGGLAAKVAGLATWFTGKANELFLIRQFQYTERASLKFSEADAGEALRLATAEVFGLEQGQRLLHLYYKLVFALMEVAGRIISEPTRMAMWKGEGTAGMDITGIEIEEKGKAGTAILGLMDKHPDAKKVHATFYPEKQEDKDIHQGHEVNGGYDWGKGLPLEFYLWHDSEAGEWVLEDFTEIEDHKENRAKGAADAPVPAALFEELNTKLRFPRGALYYRVPDEGSYRILRTTAPMTMADWLRDIAIAGLVVGLAVATLGASIPAQVIMLGAGLAMAGAEVADMVEESNQGMLNTERVLVHSALIASCVLGGASASLKMLGMSGTGVARVVAGLQVGADSVCVAVFTQEAFEGLEAAADDPEGVTFTRLLGFFLQMGMNGLMLYGVKGLALEAAGAKESAGLQGLEGISKPPKDRAARIGELKKEQATLNGELARIWKEDGILGFVPGVKAGDMVAASLGLGGRISVPNYRRLFGIIANMAKNGIELSVETVLKRLEAIGVRVNDLLSSDRDIIEMCIQDVKRADMTAEEIAFADAYLLHVEASELTNYEFRELHRRGYTINAETGSLAAPTGRTVDFKHGFLPPELRSKSIDFKKHIDFEADGDLMALVEGRQRLRERIAEMRREIKERKERGEEIPKEEMDAFNKAASEVGVMSENIAERSLQKYLDGEGFIQVYPEIGAPSSKAGDFDRIYIKEGEGRYQIFEVKGGSSQIGERIINDVAGIRPGSVAQQGTLPYLKQILHEMGKKDATKGLAGDLEFALDDGMVDYLYFKQGFDDLGNLKTPELGQFDIRDNGKGNAK